MRIIIWNKAKDAIKDIYNYSYGVSPNYAKRIISNIYNKIYELQRFPEIGRFIPELSYKYYRERICEKYRIIYYYSKNESTIYVLYIFCSRQNSKLFFQVHKNELIDFIKKLKN